MPVKSVLTYTWIYERRNGKDVLGFERYLVIYRAVTETQGPGGGKRDSLKKEAALGWGLGRVKLLGLLRKQGLCRLPL